ncbi:DUF4344 domain-containing metallopeptidase [Roseibium litorale]|nr:DUF4344 domain-containing metallopeptidase [Roseibium litorale]
MTEEARESLFEDVTGSILFVIAQQSGRMLISQLRLPVRGELNATIDALSALYLLNISDSALGDLRVPVLRSVLAIARLPASERPKYFHHQNIDPKRVDRIVCLIVGSNPAFLTSLQEEHLIDEARTEACTRDFERTKAVWGQILSSHMRQENDQVRRIAVSYNKVPRGDEVLMGMLKEAKVLETAARKLDDFYRFPAPVIMRAAACGEETATFDPRTRDFLICYDLILRFARDHLEQMKR